MKHLKTFENINKQTYWKIRTDYPYLEASLYKLNLPDKQVKYILRNQNITGSGKPDYIYVPDANDNIDQYQSWNSCNDKNENGDKYYNNKGYIYKGEVDINLEEAEMILDMKKNANKYNL